MAMMTALLLRASALGLVLAVSACGGQPAAVSDAETEAASPAAPVAAVEEPSSVQDETTLATASEAGEASEQTADKVHDADEHDHDHDHGAEAGLGAHVHGAASLGIVADGQTVTVELTSAMWNLVGFERPAQSMEEQDRLAALVNTLQRSPVSLPFDAMCEMTAVDQPIPMTEAARSSAAEDAPWRMDIIARYTFECKDITQIDRIEVDLIDRFSSFEKIDWVWIDPANQRAGTVTPARATIQLNR
jgi:hypothetical protein